MARTRQTARKAPLETDKFPAKKPSKISSSKGVTKTTEGKRAKGRGKPRAVPRAASRKPPFPFMRLPPELRDYVYRLVLPYQEPPKSGWATISGTPNKFMNLLLVNKQISAEARKILYGHNPFTMVISSYRSLLLSSFDEVSRDLRPIQAPPSLSYIKNWQLALWPEARLLRLTAYGYGDFYERDAVLSACSEIAKVDNLQSLKLSIPCLCSFFVSQQFDDFVPDDIETVHDSLVDLFVPLNQLRFAGHVQILATSTPPSFPPRGDKKGYVRLANYPHQQCSEPVCRSFAASFEPLRALLMSKSTPNSLTANQATWLALKNQVAESGINVRNGVSEALFDTWYALESGSDEFFRKMVRKVEEIVQRHRANSKPSWIK